MALTSFRASTKSLRSIVRVMTLPLRSQPSGVSMYTNATVAAMGNDLDGLIDAWLDEEFAESPVRASSLGVDGYDDQLGDYSEAGFARRDVRDEHWLASFSALDESIDRDLVLSSLRGRAVMRD